jgi:hypothetical protein
MQYQEYTDGVDTFRDGVRNGKWVIDVVIGPLGFGVGAVENVDWENIIEYDIP